MLGMGRNSVPNFHIVCSSFSDGADGRNRGASVQWVVALKVPSQYRLFCWFFRLMANVYISKLQIKFRSVHVTVVVFSYFCLIAKHLAVGKEGGGPKTLNTLQP